MVYVMGLMETFKKNKNVWKEALGLVLEGKRRKRKKEEGEEKEGGEEEEGRGRRGG